jgi:hypothetical protein
MSGGVTLLAGVLAGAMSVAGCARAERTTRTEPVPRQLADTVPTGRLGYPVGSYLTITGVRADGFKVGVRTLEVDSVNGRTLDWPINIWVDNVDALPASTPCVLEGYESARWIGTPPEVEAVTGPTSQAEWQLQRYFIVTTVVRPESAIQVR